MPRAHDSLALAASSNRHSRERRLSAILGTVLATNVGFANVLLIQLGLPQIERLNVWREERQIDLLLRGSSESSAVVVYFEHKEPGGKWQPEQPWRYLSALQQEIDGGAHGKLLVVVADPNDARGRVGRRVGTQTPSENGHSVLPRQRGEVVVGRRLGAHGSTESALETIATLRSEAEDTRMVYATWHEVAGWAWEAGHRAMEDAQWLDAALRGDTRADQRLLAELIWYLQEEGYAMTRPLDADRICLSKELFDLQDTLDELVQGMTQRLRADLGLKPIRGNSVEFHPPEGSWLRERNGRIYVAYDSSATESLDLAFYVGAYAGDDSLKSLQGNPAWQAQLTAKDLTTEGGDVYGRFDAMALTNTLTLSKQRDVLGRWATRTATSILSLEPGKSAAYHGE
jgi:hypothetical protein